MIHPPIDQQITFLYTRDLAATARFYEQTLGLPLVLDQGSCRIYRVSGDGFLGFCERAKAPDQPGGLIFTMITTQVEAWYQHLTRQGVTFEKPPEFNSDYNITHCFIRDPNGYLLEFQQFHDPTWPAKRL